MTRHLLRLVICSFLAGAAATAPSQAATVTIDDARAIATEFLRAHTTAMPGSVGTAPVYTAGSESKPLYYVFNTTGRQGFVIVSADDAATPVLGYSLESAWPAANRPEAMQWVMAGVESELKVASAIQRSNTVAESKRLARAAARKAAGQKLLATAAWSQEGPFNSLIPGKPLVGCVGTAMATIMKFYNWPAQGSGSFDGVDFGVSYDWDNMRVDNYRSGFTQTEADAVATLMYHASKSIDTQYAMSGSSAYEVRVPGALSTYFGYDPGVSYKKRAEVATQADWDKIVTDEIDAGRPVLYCGQDVTAGHAFVCDGYQGDYLHFNWGWGGAGNGYFLSTALNPTVSRTHHYNNLNTIIYNIKPATGATEWSPIHITADGNQPGLGSDLTDLASGKTFTVRAGNLKNLTYTDFSGKIAVALCGAGGQMKALLSAPSGFSLQSMATLFNGYVDFSGCALPQGTAVALGDVVRLVTQADGAGDWLPVAGELYTVNELAPATDAPATFAVTLPAAVAGVTITGADNVIRGWNYTFKVVPENPEANVVTVKSNGYVLAAAADHSYTIQNVREPQTVSVLVQNAADVKEKRSVWVGTPGTLASVISEEESGTVKELTLFGVIDARDFAFIRNSMRLTRLDLSGVTITAHGSDQANAIPREAFRGVGTLDEVVLPASVNRLNNGCFRQCSISTISIPANVKTYEYNVFCGASRLRHIYVGRESAEFINWCVLSGVRVAEVTLHVPSERAVSNYRNAENWKTIANIVVEKAPELTDPMFAVMDNADVKFDCETLPGRVAKGTTVTFAATHIADDDNAMQVYANNTLLSADAEGRYTATVNANTIIHFDLVAPIETSGTSPWTLTGKNGSVGLLTDAVNVIPGQDFTIRVNAMNIPAGLDQMFWAAALCDDRGYIKEFISPVNLWTAGAADNHKFTVNCRVNDSKVREGNTIRIVTSAMKKIWSVVNAAGEDIVEALPALNNMTPVHNITVPEVAGATVSGVTATAVHGRDLTLKVVPNSAAHRLDVTLNGQPIATEAASVNHTFVVKEDVVFDIKVYDPKESGAVVYDVKSGELFKKVTNESVRANVIVTGETYAGDLAMAFTQPFAQKTVKKLDLSGLTIIADPNNSNSVANMIPSELFYKSSGIGQTVPVVEEIILPVTVDRIGEAAFKNCANLKEIRLPESLVPERIVIGQYASGNPKYGFRIGAGAFQGCTSLTTIYIPGPVGVVNGKQVVCHFDPLSTYFSGMNEDPSYNLGHTVNGKYDASQTTIVVPAQYLNVYRTEYKNKDYGNPWKQLGYNIVSENPVYGVNFDASRVRAAEGVDVSAMASFLAENVTLESIKAEGKLKLVNPDIACKVYDNGTEITPAADGSIDVEFFNPAKKADAAGNHDIKVIYTYDVNFNSTSPLFSLSEPVVKNDSELAFHSYDTTEALAPVLRNVAENSSVTFKVGFSTEHDGGLLARVMCGQQELEADEDGLYSLDITSAGKTVEIYAVPTDGATLNAEELAAIHPDEAAGITTIAFAGKFEGEQLAAALAGFTGLENLDLGDYEGDLPDKLFSGMDGLTTVVLPEVSEIGAGMFSGCSSLQSVDVPPTVSTVGEGAFKDCESLETIRLTSIETIGDGAFDGCSNLTTVTLLAGHGEAAAAPARMRRAAGISRHAFDGINPNCVIVLDQGVTAPSSAANCLYTSTGTVTETMPDGSTAEREGRIYTADGNINFTEGYPLAIPHTFSLAEDAAVTLSTEATGKWTGLIVPFDAARITGADGTELTLATAETGETAAHGNLVFTLAEDADEMESVTAVKANTPYIWRTEAAGKVVFSATGIKVAANPAAVSVQGAEYALAANYGNAEKPAAETYLLDENGYAFVAAGDEEETIALKPFEVYASAPASFGDIVIKLPGSITGAENPVLEVTDLTVSREGNTLVICSPEARTETLYSVDGRAVRVLNLAAGRNVVEAPAPGIYILAKVKFAL